MTDFKIVFPEGYNVNDYNDDNIDLNIIIPSGQVFFSTFLTILNINNLMIRDNDLYFWATDMIIVKNLMKETIKSSVSKMISDRYLESACSEIGKIHEIFPDYNAYSDLISHI
ncbi:hypothetical protein [Chryseobacterium sp. ISL-6]|uniref:hypothetical protein n=1 Tax=Chryseobacterium sp. ISL-6 TaxID=2819143 RepID=UPI001BEAE814|nr:hypothetical protein [Chryseobacterium sp. ISL-6]MBT2622620.1 hypothetical protein [Chryseobacterium sp. ISL-6]